MPLTKNAAPGNDPEPTPTTEAANTTQDKPTPGKLTYHDSQTGRSVDADGRFIDGSGEVPKHQVVCDAWPGQQ